MQVAAARAADGLHLAEVHRERADAPELGRVVLLRLLLAGLEVPAPQLRIPATREDQLPLGPVRRDVGDGVAMAGQVQRLLVREVPQLQAHLGQAAAHQRAVPRPIHRDTHRAAQLPLDGLHAGPVLGVPHLELQVAAAGEALPLPGSLHGPDPSDVGIGARLQLVVLQIEDHDATVTAAGHGPLARPVGRDRAAAVSHVREGSQAAAAAQVP
mmetsp:Transcript_42675/g.110345  ORF Transcript_42675/g.110345 Transcript_42675/m.110345 type:complete len:213 (+) Transcript_42675:143-781(+)